MNDEKSYDAIIIGGGLAGLCFSILLAQAKKKVILFEKEVYPFHKVCGEYISMESWNFLERLGVPLREMNLPIIKNLRISSPSGTLLKQELDLGGFGISRYLLDNTLKNIAEANGVTLIQGTKVLSVSYKEEKFYVETNQNVYTAVFCAGSFGKRSNLDISWQRPFVHATKKGLNNYIGVKYHIEYASEADTISLHNFEDGYCGISKIEDNLFCLCYLTTAANLKRSGNDIGLMEERILSKNKYLKQIFQNSKKRYTAPLTISQISFHKKNLVQDHVLCLGDAAGMITPLCGNGMSMAMQGALIASKSAISFLSGTVSRTVMENEYEANWNQLFSTRVSTGRKIQKLFGHPYLTNIFISIMKMLPGLTKFIIRATHGKPF